MLWLDCQQIPKAKPPVRPIVLLLDGNETHNEVLPFCLPPHCSHVLQPLDVGFFSFLKAHWKKACKTFAVNNHDVTVNKMNFVVFSRIAGTVPSPMVKLSTPLKNLAFGPLIHPRYLKSSLVHPKSIAAVSNLQMCH